MSESPKDTSQTKPSKKWVKWLLIGGGAMFALVLIAIIALSLYFNDAYFKAQLQQVIKDELGRECEISGMKVSLFSGSVTIDDFHLLNADKNFKDKDTLRFQRASAKVSLWPAVFSKGKKLTEVMLELDKPEFLVQRRGIYPMETSNIDDLIKKFTQGPPGTWPKHTGLQALDFTIKVNDGAIVYQDSAKHLGTSRFEKLNLTAKLPGLGQAMSLNSSGSLVTPDCPNGGTAEVKDGKIVWIDSTGDINPAAFKDVLFVFAIKDLDIPHLSRHAKVAVNLADDIQMTLGKPVSGTMKFEAASFDKTHFTAAMETDGAIALWRGNERIAGNIASSTEIDIQGGWSNGHLKDGPIRVHTVVAGSIPDLKNETTRKHLDLQIDTLSTSEGKPQASYTITFKSHLDDLFATDVGKALDLKDQIGGDLDGKIQADIGETLFKAVGSLKSDKGYVAYQGLRQPTTLDSSFTITSKLDDGVPQNAEISFKANADSFQMETLNPVLVNNITQPKKLAAQTKLKTHVDGRQFWKQFGPLLKVMKMTTPLEEAFDGEVVLDGSPGKLKLEVDGTMKHQAEPPAPIKLLAKAIYDGDALIDVPTAPFLTFDFQVKSANDKMIDIGVAGDATRGKTQQIINAKQHANGDLALLNTLHQRFGDYVRVFMGPDFKVSGTLAQNGDSKLTQTLGADGKVMASDLSFTTTINLLDFKSTGPALWPNCPTFNWADPKISVELGLTLQESNAATRFALKPMKLSSEALSVEGELGDADVAKLKAAAAAQQNPIKYWMDALPQAKLHAKANAVAVKQLQTLGLFRQISAFGPLADEPLIVGDLEMSLSHDAATHKLALENVSFSGAAGAVNVSAPEIELPPLAALGEAPWALNRAVKAAPTIGVDARLTRAAVQRLQDLKLMPAEVLAVGDLKTKISFDAKTSAATANVVFSNSAVALNGTVSGLNLAESATLLDGPKPPFAKLLALAPNASLQATASSAAVQTLQTRGIIPNDPAISGDIKLNASLEGATHLLKLDSLEFTSPAAKMVASATNLDVTKAGAFLDLAPAAQTLAAIAQILPDLKLDLTATPALFNFLQKQKLAPFDPNLVGDLALNTEYQQAGDRLIVNSLRYTPSKGSNNPLQGADAALEISQVKKIAAELATPQGLTPASLMPHFEKGLQIKSLVFGPAELFTFLRRQGIATEMMDDAIAGVYKFGAPISISNLTVKSSDSPGVAEITFSANTALDWYPRSAPGKAPVAQAAARVSGVSSFAPLRVNLAPDKFSAQGALVLDALGIDVVSPLAYKKPAGTPCKLSFNITQPIAATYQIAAMDLNGGRLGFALSNLACNTAAAKPVITLEQLQLREGPLPCTVKNALLDLNAEKARFAVDVPQVDLAQAGTFAPLPTNCKLTGSVQNLKISFDGGLKFTPADKFAFGYTRADAVLAAPGVTLNLSGDMSADSARAASKSTLITIQNSGTAGSGEQKIQCSFAAAPRNAGDGLLSALQKDGLPLAVQIQAAAPAKLNLDQLLAGINALSEAMSPQPAANPANSNGMAAIKDLRLELSARAPEVDSGGYVLTDVDLSSLVLDKLKAQISGAKATGFGGALALKKANYDLSNDAHSLEFELTNLDLHVLAGPPPKSKDEYQVYGRLWSSGTLSGTGFDKAARQSWNGNINSRLADVMAMKNDGKPAEPSLSGFALKTVSGLGIGNALGLGKVGRKLDWGLLLYSEQFGLFLNKIEFEPFELNVAIKNGIAMIPQTALVGKGKSAGLQIDYMGNISLPKEEFAPRFSLWLAKIPPTTQKVLQLDQVDAADRDKFLAEFNQHTFPAIVLSGPISNYRDNKLEVARAFSDLDDRIEEKIAAKKAREQPQPPPAQPAAGATQPGTGTASNQPAQPTQPKQPAQPKPPKQEKRTVTDDLMDLFKKKKD